jgi:hypothetical protein
MTMNIAFVIIFYYNLVRIVENDNKCSTYNRLFGNGTRVKKRQKKQRADVHLLATNSQVIFWSSVFYNHFNNVFCNSTSTLLL